MAANKSKKHAKVSEFVSLADMISKLEEKYSHPIVVHPDNISRPVEINFSTEVRSNSYYPFIMREFGHLPEIGDNPNAKPWMDLFHTLVITCENELPALRQNIINLGISAFIENKFTSQSCITKLKKIELVPTPLLEKLIIAYQSEDPTAKREDIIAELIGEVEDDYDSDDVGCSYNLADRACVKEKMCCPDNLHNNEKLIKVVKHTEEIVTPAKLSIKIPFPVALKYWDELNSAFRKTFDE